jgi:glycosyltransferase involved in cell wall biosynthesis
MIATKPGADVEPRFSVVISTYNRADLIPETIDSVLAQSYPSFEIIVVDDGSTDDTVGALAPYRDRIRYVRQENGGFAAARNRGIREARGEYVAFLDSDDLYEPAFLARVLDTFREFPDAGAVFVAETAFVHKDDPRGKTHSKRTPGRYFTTEGMVGYDTGVGSGRPPVIARSLLLAHGGFDERVRCAADCEMWIRYSFDVKMVILPEPLVRRRTHPGNISRNQAVDAGDWLAILDWLKTVHPEFVARHPWIHRRTTGKHRLRLGRELLALDSHDPAVVARARSELAQAIRAYPFFLRAYLLLGVGLLWPSSYPAIRRLERRYKG